MIGTTPSTSTSSSGITAPMNINAVIAHLVEMTPPQRKQFAQMHMDDPMMLSAAKFVDNQISKQAAAMSAQRMGAAPPPVNQQVVAQMSPQPPAPQAAPMPQATPQPQGQAQPMPEDTGIAQLPAQNMRRMADGGIVGYAEGGTTNALGQEIDPATGYPVPVYRRLLNALTESPGYQNYREMVDNPYGYTGRSGPHPRNMPSKETSATPITSVAPATNAGAGGGQGSRGTVSAPPERPAALPKEKQGIDQLRVDAGPQTVSKPTVTDTDYGAMFSDLLKKQGDPRANLPPEIQANADLTKALGEKELAAADKRALGLQALVDERNTRLAGREGRLKEQEELNPNMSLITAGLAMMQSTGKGLAGIGEGATKGVAQYMEGVKYNTAQRQKLEDARDALAELKYNGDTMTEKDRIAAQNTITQGGIAANNAVINTIQHREGVNNQTASELLKVKAQAGLEEARMRFQANEGALDRQNRAAIANASAAVQERIAQMPGATERLYATLGGGDAKKGLTFFSQATAEGKGDEALLGAIVKEPMIFSNLPKDLQNVVTNTLRARLQGPKLVDLPASQVKP